MRKLKVDEYEVVEDLSNGVFKALRHNEEWRDLIGDNFVLALVEKLDQARNLLDEAHDTLDDVHCYDTEIYNDISNFLNDEPE